MSKIVILYMILVISLVINTFLLSIGFNLILTSFLFSLILVLFFYTFDQTFKIGFQKKHYILAVLIAFTGPTLVIPANASISFYDKIIHFIHPLLLSPIVFYVLSKSNLSKSSKLFLTFFIVLGSFTLFEIGEFVLDGVFDLKLQGVYERNSLGIPIGGEVLSPNEDTMIDIILSSSGALLYVIGSSLASFLSRRF